MPVKSDCFANAKSLHDDEAGRMAERIRLVFVSTDEGGCFFLILGRETFNDTEFARDAVKERKRIRPAITGSIQQKRICLENNGIGGN